METNLQKEHLLGCHSQTTAVADGGEKIEKENKQNRFSPNTCPLCMRVAPGDQSTEGETQASGEEKKDD